MRALRSLKKRRLLYRDADGRCSNCGAPLGDDWHADHIEPLRLTGRTNVHEMQALCVDCNLKKGGKSMNRSNMRAGVEKALETIIRKLRQREPFITIVMATRYGKSDVIRLAAIEASKENLACASLVLSATEFLRGQIVAETKVNKMLTRYEIAGPPFLYLELDRSVRRPNANGEILISTTYHLLHHNIGHARDSGIWEDWVESEHTRTGLPVLVFADECQNISDEKRWGVMLQRLADRGAVIVLLTATPERADGQQMLGFRYIEKQKEDVTLYRAAPHADPEKINVDVYEGVTKLVVIDADHTTGFRQAWDENALCHISRHQIEVSMSDIEDSNWSGKLHEIKNSGEARKALAIAVKDATVITKACEIVIDDLRVYRRLDPTLAAIIFCGNDRTDKDGERLANREAKRIKHELTRQAPDLRCIIATTADDPGNGPGKENLERFAAGDGDVLIVKQMASAGVDISRLKVGLDLSSVRTVPTQVQMMTRIATPHELPNSEPIIACSWITPLDNFGDAIWQKMVRDEGGETTVTAVDFVRRYEKRREEKEDHRKFQVEDVAQSQFDDSAQHQGERDEIDAVRDYLDLFPELAASLTRAQIAERLRNAQSQYASNARNTGNEIEKVRRTLNEKAKQLTNKRMPQPYDQTRWGDTIKQIWVEVYNEAGLGYVELRDVTDIQTLRHLDKIFVRKLAENRKP